MALLIENPGVLATVQDRGRNGCRSWGVPVGGAFDGHSHDLANALLANPPDAATLELTLSGGRYRAEVPLALALAGAPFEGRIEQGWVYRVLGDDLVQIETFSGDYVVLHHVRRADVRHVFTDAELKP